MKSNMNKENIWEVCEHVFIGSANEVLLRHDKIALCKLCTSELTIEHLHTVYKSQLIELIKDIDIIAGTESLNEKEL